MAAAECARFRDRFEVGDRDPHRDTCPDCASYARLIEALPDLAFRHELPERMRARLLAIAEPPPALPLPAPPRPLPPELRGRLLAIPAAGGRAAESPEPFPGAGGVRRPPVTARGRGGLPASLRGLGHAVAASYLLVVALGLGLGNPYDLGAALSARLEAEAEAAWTEVATLRDEALTSVRARSMAAREAARQSLDRKRAEALSYGADVVSRLDGLKRTLLPQSSDPVPESADSPTVPTDNADSFER